MFFAIFFSKLTSNGFNNNDNGNCWTIRSVIDNEGATVTI